jgi:23S rRNA pseudouridine2604 synthase
MKKHEYPIRINRYLALHNYSTRTGGDKLIQMGYVKINGKVAVLGDKVNESDVVEISHSKKTKTLLYFAYNKPKGIITHSAQKGEREIKDISPIKGVFPVGRLDKSSHGLIILTNDGRVTDRLLNPEYYHEKEYIVTTIDRLRSNFKKKMETGIDIGDYVTKKCRVDILNNSTFRIVLTEGKKHQIRRMCDALFCQVKDLERVRIMNIKLNNLLPGDYRPIKGAELAEFLKNLDL